MARNGAAGVVSGGAGGGGGVTAPLTVTGSTLLTVPISPDFATAHRRRPSRAAAVTAEEATLLEMEAERDKIRQQARANQQRMEKLFSAPAAGSAAAPAASRAVLTVRSQTPLTRPAEFHLHTADRAHKAPSTAVAVTAPPAPPAPLTALPVPRRIFHSSGEWGVPKVEKRPCTQPQPFTFHTQHTSRASNNTRGNKGPEEEEEGEERRSFCSSADHRRPSLSVRPSRARMAPVTPSPFRLRTEERGLHKVRHNKHSYTARRMLHKMV